ncbi:MAG: MBL fold metallo-hydrolase [Roseomonas sp.]|nr:MBL fold metallo-hydrolase [Roseomonas sp.]MCA3329395.1 MBL fold metallo-hydrolase [Roseomonas sp.]MCA3330542.1 MBL fold metallo-hydrolase [Roseomonas sp.]MCA3335656.1 MBL fold metallo-hydrolase [Roseomonas sp.]MCA3348228.1 MBL fold metallo-hydrolase [Roseomonas sp.]
MQSNRRSIFLAAGMLLASPAIMRHAMAQPAPAPQTQAPGFYRFKVGSFTVTTVHDGFVARPLEGFVRNAPLAEVQGVLRDAFLPTDRMVIPYTVTFLDTGRDLIVFDSGNGVTPAGATIGRMIANMQAAGIDPTKVTRVVMSHFHGDHVNGLLNAEGAAAFPNAEVIVPEAEIAWWGDATNETRSPEGQRANFANSARRLAPYAARLRRIGPDAEVVPGVRSVAAYGHTPGHTCYHIADGADQMMFVADTTNRPELLARRPEFHIIFDFDAVAAEATRRRIYDRVATDRIRITGYHFPFPANGFLAKEGSGYRFVAADWSGAV